MDKEILIAAELAELLRVDTQRIYELVRRGQIPVIKIGERQYRFSLQAINRWLENGGNIQHDHQN
jgi:excisionase family DNA binding protein